MSSTTVAISDIHGELGIFRTMLEHLLQQYGRFRLITLGDHVDRGPDSAGVMDLVVDPPERIDLIALMGNHEEAMVNSLVHGRQDQLVSWFRNGGRETLESYGYTGGDLSDRLRRHLDFMQRMPSFHDDGKRLFVHGGVDPWKSYDEQTDEDFIHSRKKFLRNIHCLDRLVVHGHTPNKARRIENCEWRINLDAAVFKSGKMPAVVFEGDAPSPRFFMATSSGAEEAKVPLLTRKEFLASREENA